MKDVNVPEAIKFLFKCTCHICKTLGSRIMSKLSISVKSCLLMGDQESKLTDVFLKRFFFCHLRGNEQASYGIQGFMIT